MMRDALDRLRPAAMLAMLLAAAGCGPSSPRTSPGPDEGNRTSDGAVGVSTADEKDFRNARVTRAEELLEGRFPGVQVIRNSSGGISVRIRGATSFSGSTEPLYILDGMPIDTGPGGALVGINPNDIAKIEVLKDVAATSMYGVRGANGVVVITTKRN